MIKISTKSSNIFVLKAIFNVENINKNIIKNKNHITEFISKKEAFIYLGSVDSFDKEALKKLGKVISKTNREYEIDVPTFVSKKITAQDIIWQFVESYEFQNANLFSAKTSKKLSFKNLILINVDEEGKKVFKKAIILAKAKNYTRDLQIIPSNILHSEEYANLLKKEFSNYSNISIKILDKKQITDLKMGLLLSVNKGSAYEPRVVILEYKGDPTNKSKTVMVGKGITFDSGGMNIKIGKHMLGMKYDMSGSAIIAGTIKAVAELKPKVNVAGVLVITDNMINSHSSKPDDVWIAMNGKSVEINNTDAEGRLALADGLTYAIEKLNATRLVDVATLTGAVLSALGHTYTGVWTTTNEVWEDVVKAAKKANELVWRMPLHKDFFEYMKKSEIADFRNTDYTGMAGASTAAMFLNQFTQNKEYIHMDVAGTANANNKPLGAMVKTLFELVNK